MATQKKTTTKKPAPKKAAVVIKAAPKVSGASKSKETREAVFWGVVGYAIMVTLILAIDLVIGGGAIDGGGSGFSGGGDGKDYHYDGSRTWIAVDGAPVELMVLNDPACSTCDPTQGIDGLKKATTEALVVSMVDVNTREGKALAEEFQVLAIPTFILGKGFDELEVAGGLKPKEQLASVLTEKNGKYLVQSSALGLKPGQYIKQIPFADLDTEPSEGKGKVRVVEFTDFQCPYCKRLHDNNKALIRELIDTGKIEYVMKDFPLSFHLEAPAMHAVANCTLKAEGQAAYDVMKDYIFEMQATFNKIGAPATQDRLIAQAATLGYDEVAIRTCANDPATQAEINGDSLEGRQYGVSGTPALFIGKQLIPGAIGPDTFRQAVESQL
ncbi:MAG TPA: thioredoxin family protein [Candidatus Gracilibacteria bacterium]